MARRLIKAAASLALMVCLSAVGEARMGADRNARRRHIGRGSIAAGRAHTVMATPDGRVMAWGAGDRGQLGDGALVDRWSPIVVAGLDDVVAVSAGAAHTVALRSGGDVYAWGANTFGRLGDGTRKRRTRPVLVRGVSNVTAIAAGRAHTIALTANGQVFTWGRNTSGQLGNGNKVAALLPARVSGLPDIVSIAAGDTHSLAATRDGRVFAWGNNQFSMLGDGTTKDRLRPVAIALTDVVTVAAGATHSLALRRDGSVYSWGRGANGALGTGVTKTASTPKAIPALQATAIAAGRHFSAAIRIDGRVVAWGANESGQLGDHTTVRRLRPVVVDGVAAAEALALGDAHAIAVTTAGDVRTWGEGSSGRLGTGSIVDQAAPTEVISDIPDWGVLPEDDPDPEPPDTTPPTIVATTSPQLHAGWMTTPVTVAFQCADDVALASCPAPILVTTEGAGQRISGTATDRAGNQATATVMMDVDLNPPVLSIAAPQDQSTTSESEIAVSGLAFDLGSGISDLRCNGASAVLTVDAVSCVVQLKPGRNEIILHAVDAVGANASAAVTVTRAGTSTRLALTPATRKVEVNEVSALTLRDEFGARVEQAVWSTSDAEVVTLSDSDPPLISAKAIGTATVSAAKDGLLAEATVVVSASLAPGDTRWTLTATPSFRAGNPLFTNRVSPEVPAMFTVETQTWDQALLRAVTSDGEVLWHQHSPGIPFLADSFGGVISGVVDDVGDYRAYARIGGGSVRPWWYESAGHLGRPAQSLDGTLYAIEYTSGGVTIDGQEFFDKHAIVIDGATGRLISRTLLAREVDDFISDLDGQVLPLTPPIQCRSKRYEYGPDTVDPVVGKDGRGYLVVRRHRLTKHADCIEPFRRRPDRTIDMGLDLVILSPTAAPQTVNIFSSSCAGALGTTLPCDLPPRAYQLMPDAIGGTLVTWERGTQMVGESVFVQKSLTRVDSSGTAERPVSPGFWLEMMGQAGTAITYDDGWKAVDITTGAIKWANVLTDLAPLAARPDGGLATLDITTGELKQTDANGDVESVQPFGLNWFAVHPDGDWIGVRGSDLAAVVGEFADATRFSALDLQTHQQRVRTPGIGIWAKTHLAKEEPFDLLRYRHVSIRITPHDQAKWAFQAVGLDQYGNKFFTLGAGSGNTDTNAACGGILVSDVNRYNDVVMPPWDPLEQLPYPEWLENDKIQEMLALNRAYHDDLPYACRPEQNPGFYNSNSYAHGLLNAARLPSPRLPGRIPSLFPGWMTPVPSSVFR